MKILTDRELELIQQLIEEEQTALEKLDQDEPVIESLRRLEALSAKLFGPPIPGWPTFNSVETS